MGKDTLIQWTYHTFNWTIIGGESGHNARTFDLPGPPLDSHAGNIEAFPYDLRVREFPTVKERVDQ